MLMNTAFTNKILLSSQPQSINAIEKLIEDLKTEFNLHEDCYGNMLVAVTEAVNNAIAHGNNFNSSKNVEVSYEIDDDRVFFTIKDEGSGFDFYNIPDPTAPENLEKPTGRGIFLMKHLSDQIIFSENGRIVELYFNKHVNQ